jgi:peptidoglycan/LPS O-acetylase OafA/YrhL
LSSNRHYLRSLTILRGLAAVGVVLFHVRIFLWVGWREIQADPPSFSTFDRMSAWLSAPTPFMGEGVLLFFVISGFCIHFPNARNSKKIKLGRFYYKRMMRIYPPYLGALAMSLLVIVVLNWSDLEKESVLPSLLLCQNYIPNLNSQISTNFSLWSIPTEVELYIAYPFMLLIFKKYGALRSLTIFGLISVASLWMYSLGLKAMAFCSLTFYIFWWSGASLAELYVTRKLPRPSLFIIILSFACLFTGIFMQISGYNNIFMLQRFLFGEFFVVLVWWSLFWRLNFKEASSFVTKLLVSLGEMSYSLYLTHYPLLLFIGTCWENQYGSKPTNFLTTAMFATLTIPIAYLFHLCIELPSHKLAKMR